MNVELDYSEFERLSESIAKLADKAEDALNQSLDKRAEDLIVPRITKLIPISKGRNGRGIRDKVHAAHSKWHVREMGNLEITIKSKGGAANRKGSFGYLVFPNEGRGSKNPVALEFMEKGRDEALPELVDGIQEDLIKMIEEEL